MKRHKGLIALSRQHHDALILAQLIKRNAPPYKGLPTDTKGKRKYTLEKFKEHLVPHFEAEELIFMPFILGKDKKIDTLCSEILSEHKKIANIVEEIRIEKDVEDNFPHTSGKKKENYFKEFRKFYRKNS
jgi:iron-sulfur cluster repair protein YtfE (RIC family)